MAEWVTHLWVADEVLKQLPQLDRHGFCVGNIAPDCNLPNEEGTDFIPSRQVTHWMNGNRKTADDCIEFYNKYVLSRIDEIETKEELSFLLGYYSHLITDAEVQRTIRDPERVAASWKRIKNIPELAEKAAGLPEDWDAVKKLFPKNDRMKDFFCIEREYLDAHPDSGWFTEIQGLEYFPDYIDYLPEQSIPKKIKMMYYEPSGEKSMYPFLAFSREEYIGLIERSIRLVTEAIKDAASLSKPDYSKAVIETKDLIMKKAVFKKGSDCLEIRVAGVADASAVGKVHSEAWKSAYRGVFPDRYINSDTASKRTDEFLDSIKDDKYTYYLLQESNQTAGIVKTHAEENSLEIESFYILNEYKGKGLGSRFIDFIKNSAKPECIFLWVLEDNSKARHFYENNGFVMTGDSRMINRGTELKQIRYNLLR